MDRRHRRPRRSPTASQGLDDVASDVWQIGFERSDGEIHLPPKTHGCGVLVVGANHYVGAAMIRTDIFHDVGGFPDVAFQDWALWRKLARHGATVEPSDRPTSSYMRHPRTRGATELTTDVRPEHIAEMMEAEHAYA